MDFIKYIIIFILLYNFETIISSLTGLIVEFINYLVALIALDLRKRGAEDSTEELSHCIGFQVDPVEEDDDIYEKDY